MGLAKRVTMLAITTATIIPPVAILVLNNKATTNIDVDRSIVWYYWPQAKETVASLKSRFDDMVTKAIEDNKMTNRVNLILKEAPGTTWSGDQMIGMWGYNSQKSPDVFLDTQANNMPGNMSKSGKVVLHQFEMKEYDDFLGPDGANFKVGDLKGVEVDGRGVKQGKRVHVNIPWFMKNDYLIAYDEHLDSIYNRDFNKQLRGVDENGVKISDPVNLSSNHLSTYPGKANDIMLEDSLPGMGINWNGNSAVNAILEYLRGPNTPEGKPRNRRNTNGQSATLTDFAYIPHADPSEIEDENGIGYLKDDTTVVLESLSFAPTGGTFPGQFDKTADANGSPVINEVSETAIALHQMINDPSSKNEYNEQDQKSLNRFSQSHISSMGFQSVPKTIRTTNIQGSFTAVFDNHTAGFMGARKSNKGHVDPNKYSKDKREDYVYDTPLNDHRYKYFLFNGGFFPDKLIRDGKLTAGSAPSDNEVDNILSHYHVYRMPAEWQMDDGKFTTFNLMKDKNGTKKSVTQLDGQKIYGLSDGVATKVKLNGLVNGDFLSFNQRAWEIKDPNVRDNKVYALKLFLRSLFGEKSDGTGVDEEYAKSLSDNGIFPTKHKLLEAGTPEPTSIDAKGNPVFKNQADRIMWEHRQADKSATVYNSMGERPGSTSDYVDLQNIWWFGLYPYAEEQAQYTPYQRANIAFRTIWTSMARKDKPSEWGEPNDQY